MLVMALSACEYELSPWQTDAHCPGLSISQNTAELMAFEQTTGARDFYQVALISDPQQYAGSLEDTINLINHMSQVDFILVLGDLAQSGVKAEFEWMCTALAKAHVPVFAVIGNHDGLSFGEEIWQDIFGPLNFSFTYQNSRFVAYNDNKYEFKDVPDRDWLAQQAKITEGEKRVLTIAASHIAPWDTDLGFEEHLALSGYNLTLHGHWHLFSYWQNAQLGISHHVTSDNRGTRFGLLSIYSDGSFELENCEPECITVTASNR